MFESLDPAGGLTTSDLAWFLDALTRLGTDVGDPERIDRIGLLESIKSGVTAAQARTTNAFVDSQRAEQVAAGVSTRRIGEGIAGQVALAKREAPARAGRFVGWARVVVEQLPLTFAALERGQTSEWRAMTIAKETIWLTTEQKAIVDAELAERLPGLGDTRVQTETRKIAYRLDPDGSTARSRAAEADRRVSLRPAPDTMTRLSALLPAAQGVAAYAALSTAAGTARAAGDERTRGQVMADTLVERVTGQASAAAVPVEINLVITDRALAPATTSDRPHGEGDNAPYKRDAYKHHDESDQPQYSYADPYGNAWSGPYDSRCSGPYDGSYSDAYSNAWSDPYDSSYSDPYGNAWSDPYDSSYGDAYSNAWSDPYDSTSGHPPDSEHGSPPDSVHGSPPDSVHGSPPDSGGGDLDSADGGYDEPGYLVGYGPVPAGVARDIARAGIDTPVWLRRVYPDPATGRLAGIDATRRCFDGPTRHAIIIRDEFCRTPWCGAPIRQIDHPVPVADGGETSLDNGQGLCEACNYMKEAPGWETTPGPGGAGGTVMIMTPTGHLYQSQAPPLPGRRAKRKPPRTTKRRRSLTTPMVTT